MWVQAATRSCLHLSLLQSLCGSTISAIMASNLRSGDRNIYLIGSERHQITGCKLLSNRQVLSALFYNLHEVKLSIRESANLVERECLIFWEKARISTAVTPHCVEKIMKLYNHFNGLLTVDEEQQQFLLQCVEDHRKQYPNCKKATLKRKYD
ncbi:hypothetical protein AVEN_178285-1 [Araneus ventricosus]|uniref:Uncharacterized protein n=1 Tax=Araneus ventricosus TaxID=182803 RepID=A0A4Y2RZA1_ARAVE|nr:hypothetical protein AVEN_178285-1 [Araneus ventricosus]